MNHPTTDSTTLYRIGAVSKTTGVPVSTLRVWETRYGAFAPVKTEGNQRLFTEHDVSKAWLLKQLSQNGHSIGTIAHLGLTDLRRLIQPASSLETAPLGPQGQAVRVAVVGLGMAHRIESTAVAAGLTQTRLHVTDAFPDLPAAAQATWTCDPQVLLIQVNTLHAGVQADIHALLVQHTCERVVVVYNFAPEGVVKAMKFTGLVLRRGPLSDSELAEWLQSVLRPQSAPLPLSGTPQEAIAPRKYSDATLSRVAGIATNVLCECPRHVAELIAQLASFEQYSQECLSRHEQDAHLHTYLHALSGSARALFESALEKIAVHEGIDLNEAST